MLECILELLFSVHIIFFKHADTDMCTELYRQPDTSDKINDLK
jgi:hypothetical protein